MASRLVAVVTAPAAALALAGSVAAHPSAAHTRTVKVTAKDFSFVLSPTTVSPGRVTFHIRNAGHTRHDFEIAGHASKAIGPGKTTTLVVVLKRGRYPYKCTVDAHANLGMKGMLRVA